MTELTQEYIQSLFEYKDGELFWKIRLANRIKINDKAGTLNSEIEAAKVYNESAIQYFGKYAKLNEEI